MASIVPPRRCLQHDLAAGPDGQCAICRRATRSVAAPAVSEPERVDAGRWLFVLVAAAWIVGVAWVVAPHRLFGPAAAAHASARVVPVAPPSVAPARALPPAAVAPVAALERDGGVQAAAPWNRRPGPAVPAVVPVTASAEQRAAAERAELVARTDLAARTQREHDDAAQDAHRHEIVQQQVLGDDLLTARRNVVITMYSTSWCGVCASARDYMLRKKIPFTDLDVERDHDAKERADLLNPSGSVPVITLDHELLVGFGSGSFDAALARAAKARAGL